MRCPYIKQLCCSVEHLLLLLDFSEAAVRQHALPKWSSFHQAAQATQGFRASEQGSAAALMWQNLL